MTYNMPDRAMVHPIHSSLFIDIESYYPKIIEMSRNLFSKKGYTGMEKPWHDENPMGKLEKYNGEKRKLARLFKRIERAGMDPMDYLFLSLVCSPFHKYADVDTLINQPHHLSSLGAFRKGCTEEEFASVAEFMRCFVNAQVEHYGQALLEEKQLYDEKPFAAYRTVLGRIRSLTIHNIEFSKWLDEKVVRFKEFQPDQLFTIKTILNINGLDPSINKLKKQLKDPWYEIREFLGLSQECQFLDGSIPKGWVPSTRGDEKKIVRVSGDGYYFYADGTQRRGIYHYMRQNNLIIKCTPENFKLFKDKWKDSKFATMTPTWTEYITWGRFPGMWDESGAAINGRGKPVNWRK